MEIELAGRTHKLLPSFQAICAAEEKTGFSLLEIAEQLGDMRLSAQHMATLLYEFLSQEDQEQFSDRRAFADALMSEGMMYAATCCADLIMSLIDGKHPAGAMQRDELSEMMKRYPDAITDL